jgi:hypothetical protein
MQKGKRIVLLVIAIISASFFVNINNSVGAESPVNENKVTICHRTASRSNPYSQISIDIDSVDGVEGNGNTADHYNEHQGPIFSDDLEIGVEWGDIIPPISPYHEGLNWTEEGQAIYNNGCNPVEPVEEFPVFTVNSECATKDGKSAIKVTIVNSGEAEGMVTVNGTETQVLAGETLVSYLPTGTVEVVYDNQVIHTNTLTCNPGSGGGGTDTPEEDTTTTTTSTISSPLAVQSLPYTGSSSLISNILLVTLFTSIALGMPVALSRLRR